MFRRIRVRSLQLLVCLAIVFSVHIVITSYRYNVSLSVAGKGVLKELALYGIRVGVWIYDPYTPRLAKTAPNVERLLQSN